MKTNANFFAAWLLLATAGSGFATTHYVDLNCPNPTPPYTNWASAATVIQDAVDAAAAGDEVVVTNGIYTTGGRAAGTNFLANRVVVEKPLALQSVNGPQFTVIQGHQVTGTTNGDAAIRCVYLTNGASLSGFTLTNGATRSAGDYEGEQSGGGLWCESTNAVVSNCVLAECSAYYSGGGALRGTLKNCILSGNSAYFYGGGAVDSILTNCTLTGNSAGGGGAVASVLNDSILNNCVITGNSAGYGGGADGGTLNGCVLTGNSATGDYDGGGGTWESTLNNCTLTGNFANGYSSSGGGAGNGCQLNNCIVYFNTAPSGPNYDSSSALSFCCTTPLPVAGTGNIADDPQLASVSHLSVLSPCIGKGGYAAASGVDIDGEPWANPPSIGCDEFHAGALTGPLSVRIGATFTNVALNYPVRFTALIEGQPALSLWTFGDGSFEINQIYTMHAWSVPGDYLVTLWCFNDSHPDGISATVTIHVATVVHYVAADSTSPLLPFTSWATAATNIQDAVDAVTVPGALVLVASGVYATGARTQDDQAGVSINRVLVNKPLNLRSQDGPQTTIIQGLLADASNGYNGIRCVWLADGASLSGFTLTNGFAENGGAVFAASGSALVTNCMLSGNSADYSGGGAWGCTLEDCTLSGNSAQQGGGASYSALVDCMLNSNTVVSQGYDFSGVGGGAYECGLTNCIVSGNENIGNFYSGWFPSGGGVSSCTLYNCTITNNTVVGWRQIFDGSLPAYGGGASDSLLNNCTLTGNTALLGYGGGASGCTLNNCVLVGNSADFSGGGASAGGPYYYNWSILNNCTLRGNSAGDEGGASGSTLNNCIVYFNAATNNQANYDANYDSSSILNYCCTTPLPLGSGNIAADPKFADDWHLGDDSPCRAAGSTAFTSGVDIDGDAWSDPPSIGCDQFSALATGQMQVILAADRTNVATGFTVVLTGNILGHARSNHWDFGDGATTSNELSVYHAWTIAGDYVVTLSAYNDTSPAGVSATVMIHVAAQPVHYVSLTSVHPSPPYASWATAATNIQDAVDAATVIGALVLVTNGTYTTTGETVDGSTFNQVVVDKPVTVSSVNGPESTVIGGGSSNRCVYLSREGTLSGFTLTNGFADNGGGVWCRSVKESLSNCVIIANSATEAGGGVYGGTLNNCTLTGNSASDVGGGVEAAKLNNCVLTANSALSAGGGADASTLNNCTLTGNAAQYDGGGVYSSTLYNCIVYFNTVQSRSSNFDSSCVLNYCCSTPLPPGIGNISANPQLTDSAHLSADSSCLAVGNAAFSSGVDIDGQPWANPPSIGCDEFHPGSVTGPLTVTASANYTNVAVGFVLNFSALIQGQATLSFWDFDDGTFAIDQASGLPHSFANAGDYSVKVWAYNDNHPAGVSATLVVHVDQGWHFVSVQNLNPAPPYTSWASAATNIQDAVDATFAGGNVFVTNGVYADGGRPQHGTRLEVDKPLTVQSINGPAVTAIQGHQVTGSINGSGAIRCVYLSDGDVLSGFTLTNGATASDYGSGGIYGGGALCASGSAVVTNCVLRGNSAFEAGGGAYGVTLNACILSGNSTTETYSSGGGASYSTLNNCELTGNSANSLGGGAAYSTLNDCILKSNSAAGGFGTGGGASFCTLNNCTISGNSATGNGGGADWSTLNNCIVYYNKARNVNDNFDSSTLQSCCYALPAGSWYDSSMGITNAPLFVDLTGGNLRLQSNSPCINAGNNIYAPVGLDLDGNPRIVGGTVDIGAYEFQTPASTISYAWLQQFGLPLDGSADFSDPDGDGLNNRQEWRTGTDPTDAASVLKMLIPVTANNPPGLTVSWQSVAGANYFLQCSTNLPFFTPIASDIPGQPGTTTYTDTNAVGSGPFFYRIGVGN